MPADTRFLPTDGQLDHPDPHTEDTALAHAAYTIRQDRCVAELTMRLLGIRWLRARLAVASASLELGAGDDLLAVALAASSLRTAVPRLAKILTGETALRAEEYPNLYFTSDDIDLIDGSKIEIVGQADIVGMSRDLFLEGVVRHIDDGRVVLWLRGILPPPRRRPAGSGRAARFLARRPVHIEFAAEFVR